MAHPNIPRFPGTSPDASREEASCYAVISDRYVNFSGRLGNHFATIDSYSGPVINDNYITFSFKGGAAHYEQRVRRALVLAGILRRLGFRVTQSGDSLKAEIRKYDERRFPGTPGHAGTPARRSAFPGLATRRRRPDRPLCGRVHEWRIFLPAD
jgi:pyruvate, water dikinase